MSSDGWNGDDGDEPIDAAEPRPRVITLRPPAMPRTAAFDIPAPSPVSDAEMDEDEPYDEVFAQLRPTQVPVPARSGTTLRPPPPTLTPPAADEEPAPADSEPPATADESTPVEAPAEHPPVVEPPRSATPRWILPGILVAAALVIGYFVGTRKRDTTLPPESSVVTHAAEPETARPDPRPAASAPAPRTPTARPSAADLKQCVDGVIPLGPSITAAALDPLCSEPDAKQLVAALSKLIVGSAGVPRNTQIRWASLGSFKMAGTQLLRSTCCGNAATLIGPKRVPTCKLDAALEQINDAVSAGGDLRAASQTYFKALDCLFKTKLFAEVHRPQSFEQTAFLELIPPRPSK